MLLLGLLPLSVPCRLLHASKKGMLALRVECKLLYLQKVVLAGCVVPNTQCEISNAMEP